MDVGTELREAREQRGLSLQDLSRRTKIKIDSLKAIEENAFERLPGGIFTRGFLRAYAREVGLDPADVVRRFVAQAGPSAPPHAESTDASPRAVAAEDHSTAANEVQAPAEAWRALVGVDSTPVVRSVWSTPVVRSVWVLAIIVAAAFVLVRFAGPRSPGHAGAAVAPEGLVGSSPVESAPAGAAVATKGSVGGAGSVTRTPATLHIEFAPQAPVWVSATADGNRVIYRLMKPGEHQAVDAVDELVVRVGEPSHFAFAVNGVSGRPLGRPGRPVTVRLTRQTYEQFVER